MEGSADKDCKVAFRCWDQLMMSATGGEREHDIIRAQICHSDRDTSAFVTPWGM